MHEADEARTFEASQPKPDFGGYRLGCADLICLQWMLENRPSYDATPNEEQNPSKPTGAMLPNSASQFETSVPVRC